MTRPALRVVRDSTPPPPLELPRAEVRGPWWDSPWFGAVIAVVMLVATALVCVAMGWLR